MSAFPPKADIRSAQAHVRFVPNAEFVRGNEKPRQMAGALLSNTNDKAATSVLLIAMSVRLK